MGISKSCMVGNTLLEREMLLWPKVGDFGVEFEDDPWLSRVGVVFVFYKSM